MQLPHTRPTSQAQSADDLAQTVACSIVASRLDYCNAMLYCAPANTLDSLQLAQNNLARVVCQRGGLRSLHWLPVKQRVTYKMGTLTFKVLLSSTPAYLNDLIQSAVPVRPLRSSDAPLLSAARTQTEFARRTFSVAAPYTCNSVPPDIRSCHTSHTFKNTSKHTCLDSLSLKPPVSYPLQNFKALYKYCIIIIMWFLVPTRVHTSNGISISSAVFVGSRLRQTNGQTDRHTTLLILQQ